MHLHSHSSTLRLFDLPNCFLQTLVQDLDSFLEQELLFHFHPLLLLILLLITKSFHLSFLNFSLVIKELRASIVKIRKQGKLDIHNVVKGQLALEYVKGRCHLIHQIRQRLLDDIMWTDVD